MSACPTRIKTCQTCAAAKIRCLRSPGATICDRCARLGKPCYFRPARLRQTCPKKETRLESLEKRVDQLLGQSQPSQSHSPPTEKTGDVIDKGIISLDDAAALLDFFLQHLMPHFPFVVLPNQATASELRERKPFLFLAILSVAVTEDHALKRTLHEEFKKALAERTLLDSLQQQLSLETIQGFLVASAWSQHQDQRLSGPPAFSTYLHLAIGLVVDLEIDKPLEMQRRGRRLSIHEIGTEQRPLNLQRAEQRAALGCSFLSSCYGIITQKKCTFPWSPHLEAFALELAQNPEYPSDRSLVHLIRLQHVLEEMDQVAPDGDALEIDKNGEAFQHTFRAFKTEIEQFSSQLPPRTITNNFLLASQLHTVNLYLCQASLFDRKSISQIPTDFRAEILSHGLVAAKESFNSLVANPIGAERCFSYSQWLQSGFNLILSCKLVLMAESDASLRQSHPHIQSLCDVLDVPKMLNLALDRQPPRHSGMPSLKTGFDYSGWLQWIQEWFGQHYNEHRQRQRGQESSITSSSSTAPVVYSTQPVQFSMGDMGNLGLAENTLQWASFADMGLLDNPLAGWMDLNLLPM